MSNKKIVWPLVIFLLVMGIAIWRVATYQSDDSYVKSIHAAGGIAMPQNDTRLIPIQKVVGRMMGVDTRMPHQVWLKGPQITDHWLKQKHYFRGMLLTALMLTDSALSHDAMMALINEHKIVDFIATQVPVTDADVKLLAANHKLTSLTLIQTQITDAALDHLQPLKLFSLGVAGTQVTPQGLLSLKNMTSLKTLNLDGKQLTSETLPLLQSLKISFLVLSGPDVTDQHLELLTNLPALKFVSTHQTSVTAEGIAAFQKSHPTCVIEDLSGEDQWYQWSPDHP